MKELEFIKLIKESLTKSSHIGDDCAYLDYIIFPPSMKVVASVNENSDNKTTLACNPNPANGISHISFYIPKSGNVSLNLIDLNGRIVDRFIDNQNKTYLLGELPAVTGVTTQILDTVLYKDIKRIMPIFNPERINVYITKRWDYILRKLATSPSKNSRSE